MKLVIKRLLCGKGASVNRPWFKLDFSGDNWWCPCHCICLPQLYYDFPKVTTLPDTEPIASKARDIKMHQRWGGRGSISHKYQWTHRQNPQVLVVVNCSADLISLRLGDDGRGEGHDDIVTTQFTPQIGCHQWCTPQTHTFYRSTYCRSALPALIDVERGMEGVSKHVLL